MNVSIRRADCLEALVTAMEYAADESVELRNPQSTEDMSVAVC